MGKGGQTKGPAIKQKPADVDTIDAAALQAEVKSFASGLGLAAAGVGSGFDDSDFRPPVNGHEAKAKLIKSNDVPKSRPDAQQQKRPVERQAVKATGATGQQQPEVPDIVRERNWNAGVGPRPGELQHCCRYSFCCCFSSRNELICLQTWSCSLNAAGIEQNHAVPGMPQDIPVHKLHVFLVLWFLVDLKQSCVLNCR